MLLKKSPSQPSRPTSAADSVHDSQSLRFGRGGCLSVNLGSTLGRRIYLWQMLVFPLVPIVLLVGQNSQTIYEVTHEHRAAQIMEKEVSVSRRAHKCRGTQLWSFTCFPT